MSSILIRFRILALIILTGVGLPGCSSRVTGIYGESEGYAAKCSPGGLSVFRTMVEDRGFTTYTVRSLSPTNMRRLNTLVWCPDSYADHNKETWDWIDQWLTQGERTLVYIGRDYSPHEAYWSTISKQQGNSLESRSQWLVASEEAALARSTLDGKRRASRSVRITPWCRWEFQEGPFHEVQQLTGPWSEDITAEDFRIAYRSKPVPLRSKELNEWKKHLDSLLEQSTTNASVTKPANTPTKPFEPQWSSLDIQQREIANGISPDRLPAWTTLLSDSSKTPLIGVVSHDSISNSHIIVVNNSSLLCNFSMLREPHRQLATKLVDEFSFGGIGFLTGERDPMIREDNREDQQRGFEMLTTWPLNVVTIHAAFLGIAVIIAAFPIFGRPKQLPRTSSSDFGLHVEAVGQLMQSSGDTDYAKKQIADYFRIVRKDTTSPWANIAPPETKTDSPFAPPKT